MNSNRDMASVAVSISGQIGSGKSTVVDELAKLHGWDIVSFSKYVRYQAASRNLPATRKSYQLLGQKLFVELGPYQFLKDAIEFNMCSSRGVLFDGIRHVEIVQALRRLYPKCIVVFLDVTDLIRFSRFTSRSAAHDRTLSFEEFLGLSLQPVESEILEIKNLADLCVDASDSINGTLLAINNAIYEKLDKV